MGEKSGRKKEKVDGWQQVGCIQLYSMKNLKEHVGDAGENQSMYMVTKSQP